MKPGTQAQPSANEPAVVLYQFVCLAGLGLILFARLTHGVGLPDMLTLVVGLLGIIARLRLAPLLLLILLAGVELGPRLLWAIRGWGSYELGRSFHPSDVALSCGMLAYAAGHFRLQGLVSHILPVDRRQREGLGSGRAACQRRPASLVTAVEVVLFVLALPLWALLAQACLTWLSLPRNVLQFSPLFARLLLLTWALGIGGLISATILGQWRRRSMSAEEAELLLQDILWRETRREQRRLQRWLAWSRLRRSQREEER